MTADCSYTLQWDSLPRSKLPLPMGMLTPSNRPTWFLRPTQVLEPNGISIGSAVFAGFTTVTDGPTDGQTDGQTTLLCR